MKQSLFEGSGAQWLGDNSEGEPQEIEKQSLQTRACFARIGSLPVFVKCMWEFNDLNSQNKSLLLDMTPGSAKGAEDTLLLIGRTFVDAELRIYLTPVAKGGTTPESLDVVVNIGKFPGNAAPQVKITADSRSVRPGQTIHFKADQSRRHGWRWRHIGLLLGVQQRHRRRELRCRHEIMDAKGQLPRSLHGQRHERRARGWNG